MSNLNRIVEDIIKLVIEHKSNVPKGFKLYKQSKPENLDDELFFLTELFTEEEKMIVREQAQNYVTDNYENGVRKFATALMKLLIPHHGELKDNSNYEALCGKRHIAYGYYKVKSAEVGSESKSHGLDVKYCKLLYMGLVEFYSKFYGSFYDNEEAIILLCKFYPKGIGIERGQDVRKVSSALYSHISNAGTPNDFGYAYQGIELIEKYIHKLPEEVVTALLNEFPLYYIVNNKVTKHQIFTIIEHAEFTDKMKVMYKFWYMDSLLIANIINKFLLDKLRKEETEVNKHNNYIDWKLLDEKLIVFDKPFTYWDNDSVGDRVLFMGEKPVIRIRLQEKTIEVYDIIEKQNVTLKYEYTDWMLENYTDYESDSEIIKQLRELVFEANINEAYDPMLLSLAYLDNYRGMENQIIDFDHRFVYDHENRQFLKNTDAASKIPHIYGKSVYSLSCIVGKNATGKTSIMDFLRETFFKFLKLIEEQQLSCKKGCVCEKEYKDYNILDRNARFMVIFSFGEKDYFLTNIEDMKVTQADPFDSGTYNNVNELSKVAYFSNQLRCNQEELLIDKPVDVTYNEERRRKQNVTKINNGFRQVDYSETESFIRKRKAIELAQREKDMVWSVNKDICYQLSFLKKTSAEKLCEYIDITNEKKFSLISFLHGDKKKTFSLDELKEEEKIKEFVKIPDTIMGHFSAGQYAKLSFLAKLQWFLEGDKEEIKRYNELLDNSVFSNEEVLLNGETALIFIDEGEIYYHPEWQRKYIKTLLDMVNIKPRKVQIIVTTNSPFIISDILNDDITYLLGDKSIEKTEKRKADYTLGQNIHKLLKDNFFMQYTIGEYARELIENIMVCLQEEEAEEKEEKKNDIRQKMDIYFDNIEDYYDAFNLLIEQIGEPVYKYNLKKMLEESSFAKEKNQDVGRRISELEEEKRKLEEKINKLKEENQI